MVESMDGILAICLPQVLPFHSLSISFKVKVLLHSNSKIGRHSLQELSKLANSRIADEDIQSSKSLHGLVHKILSRLRLRHIALNFNQPPGLLIFLFYSCRFFKKGGLMVGVRGQIEMIDGDVAALSNIFKGYSAPNSCRAAGYCGGFGE